MDSRTCSILLNLNLSTKPSGAIANKYYEFVTGINKSEKEDATKTYDNLRQTVKECYLTGSLKYGNNFVY